VVVGDSMWDIEAAKEAGVRTAAVMTGGAFSRAESEEAGAYAVYEDCAELLEAVSLRSSTRPLDKQRCSWIVQ
jgi:phosphoglycolate phosphatase-like HAD superfamily hydrolase